MHKLLLHQDGEFVQVDDNKQVTTQSLLTATSPIAPKIVPDEFYVLPELGTTEGTKLQ
jgi:hypothetical protein